jgi:hypothetical protein
LPIALEIEAAGGSVTVSGLRWCSKRRGRRLLHVSQEELATLPLNGRQFLDIALLIRRVIAQPGSTQLFAETSAIPGSGLSVGSQRNLSNNSSLTDYRPTTPRR